METPVYIEAVLSEGNITFNIYGKEVRPEGRTVEYISESLETVESDERDTWRPKIPLVQCIHGITVTQV